MKLYEINLEQHFILEEMISVVNNPDVPDDMKEKFCGELQNRMNMLTGEKTDKIINMGRYIKNLNVDLEGFKVERERLAKRTTVIQNKIKSLRRFMKMFIEPGEKFASPQVTISWRKSKQLQTDDDFQYPEVYRKEQPWKPDKRQLIADLKADIFRDPKCRLIEKQNLSVK